MPLHDETSAFMTPHIAIARRCAAALLASAMTVAVLLFAIGTPANAAIVATVPLGTAANYSVLGFSTVTNTGPSVLAEDLGLWSGTSITGFPPGTVLGATDLTNGAAQQAQSDRTAAYVNAAGRPVDGTTTADLGNLNLQGGVYAGPSHGALQITGPLVLDGAGNEDTVFIFQTDSTLTTASGSTVSLINGAQACNVFWQVGSSATLGTSSVFVGNILASASITVTTGATVEGRALAGAAVTLDTNTFTVPSCEAAPPVTSTSPATTPATTPDGTPDTTPDGTPDTSPGNTPPTTTLFGPPGQGAGPGVPGVEAPPRTGGAPAPSDGYPGWALLVTALILATATVGAFGARRVRGAPARFMDTRLTRR